MTVPLWGGCVGFGVGFCVGDGFGFCVGVVCAVGDLPVVGVFCVLFVGLEPDVVPDVDAFKPFGEVLAWDCDCFTLRIKLAKLMPPTANAPAVAVPTTISLTRRRRSA